MKRYFFLMALCMSLILTQAAYARDYIVVLSPVHFDYELKAQNKDVLRFLVSQVKPGEKATIIDGWHLKTIAEFAVKDDPKYNHPKIKIRSNPHVLRALNAFADSGLRNRLHAGVQIPQLYQYLGQNFAPFTDTTIIMLASPLYQDKHNPDWGIMNNMYPGDGHLNAPRNASQFSVDGLGNLLKGSVIHWGHPYVWQSDDMYALKVTRFQHLLAEGHGSKIATFTGDMASLWRRVAENAAPVLHGFTRDTTEKLETIEIVDPPQSEERTSIYERELEAGKPSLAQLRQARDVQIGISWSAKDVDLDLHVQPHASAKTLYFGHRVSDEGFYHKDFTQSPETENGYETVTMNVPLDVEDVLIAINHYSGRAETVSGEIRLAIGDKTYGMPFQIRSTRGNKGLAQKQTIQSRKPANDNWLVIDPTKIMGL